MSKNKVKTKDRYHMKDEAFEIYRSIEFRRF